MGEEGREFGRELFSWGKAANWLVKAWNWLWDKLSCLFDNNDDEQDQTDENWHEHNHS